MLASRSTSAGAPRALEEGQSWLEGVSSSLARFGFGGACEPAAADKKVLGAFQSAVEERLKPHALSMQFVGVFLPLAARCVGALVARHFYIYDPLCGGLARDCRLWPQEWFGCVSFSSSSSSSPSPSSSPDVDVCALIASYFARFVHVSRASRNSPVTASSFDVDALPDGALGVLFRDIQRAMLAAENQFLVVPTLYNALAEDPDAHVAVLAADADFVIRSLSGQVVKDKARSSFILVGTAQCDSGSSSSSSSSSSSAQSRCVSLSWLLACFEANQWLSPVQGFPITTSGFATPAVRTSVRVEDFSQKGGSPSKNMQKGGRKRSAMADSSFMSMPSLHVHAPTPAVNTRTVINSPAKSRKSGTANKKDRTERQQRENVVAVQTAMALQEDSRLLGDVLSASRSEMILSSADTQPTAVEELMLDTDVIREGQKVRDLPPGTFVSNISVPQPQIKAFPYTGVPFTGITADGKQGVAFASDRAALQSLPRQCPITLSWFERGKIDIHKERPHFAAWFGQNGNTEFAQKEFMRVRNSLIDLYAAQQPVRYMSLSDVRGAVAGGSDLLIRLHYFLDSVGLINYLVRPGSLARLHTETLHVLQVPAHGKGNQNRTLLSGVQNAYRRLKLASRGSMDVLSALVGNDLPAEMGTEERVARNAFFPTQFNAVNVGFSRLNSVSGPRLCAACCEEIAVYEYKDWTDSRNDAKLCMRWALRQNGEVVLCVECFADGKFDPLYCTEDFTLVSDSGSTAPGALLEGNNMSDWTAAETTVLLREAAQRPPKSVDDWHALAGKVRSADNREGGPSITADECIHRMLQLSSADPVLRQTWVPSQKKNTDIHPIFLTAQNPLKMLLGFTASFVSPNVACVGAKLALKLICECHARAEDEKSTVSGHSSKKRKRNDGGAQHTATDADTDACVSRRFLVSILPQVLAAMRARAAELAELERAEVLAAAQTVLEAQSKIVKEKVGKLQLFASQLAEEAEGAEARIMEATTRHSMVSSKHETDVALLQQHNQTVAEFKVIQANYTKMVEDRRAAQQLQMQAAQHPQA